MQLSKLALIASLASTLALALPLPQVNAPTTVDNPQQQQQPLGGTPLNQDTDQDDDDYDDDDVIQESSTVPDDKDELGTPDQNLPSVEPINQSQNLEQQNPGPNVGQNLEQQNPDQDDVQSAIPILDQEDMVGIPRTEPASTESDDGVKTAVPPLDTASSAHRLAFSAVSALVATTLLSFI